MLKKTINFLFDKLSVFKLKTFFISALIILIIALLTFIADDYIDQWTNKIIESSKLVTEVSAEQLVLAANDFFSKNNLTSILEKENPSREEIKKLDSLLSDLSKKIFSQIPGIEGGFYFTALNEFSGYSFPTSPPPIPTYGPPPRSYNIILTQVRNTIIENRKIVNMHKFDPAIFPLVTQPFIFKKRPLGAVWTRIHIERELPYLKLKEVSKYATAISIIGFIIAIIGTLRLRKRIVEIKTGLEYLKSNKNFRFKEESDMFGFIGKSINEILDSLSAEHIQRQNLESELHQQDKMASLGKLVAGVAHEVKTPLAIIKTRIQMWQEELSDSNLFQNTRTFTKDSLNIVVNEIDRLSKLVKKLLVFSKPSKLNKTLADLNQIIRDTLYLLEADKSSKLEIKSSLDIYLPPINIDITSVNQMLLNILTNSIESMKDGGKLEIITKYFREKEIVELTISDTGCGISEEIKDKIFDPFFTTKEHGAGLGLSIVYEIVKAHKGNITFSKNNPTGTICKIELPCN